VGHGYRWTCPCGVSQRGAKMAERRGRHGSGWGDLPSGDGGGGFDHQLRRPGRHRAQNARPTCKIKQKVNARVAVTVLAVLDVETQSLARERRARRRLRVQAAPLPSLELQRLALCICW
jgi:hypothetical protein